MPASLAVAVAALLVATLVAVFADRIGTPALLVFLAVGIVLGEDGPGGIRFDDAVFARDAGSVAVALILLEGGALTLRRDIEAALRPALSLATLGVLATAGIVGVAAKLALGISWTSALLVGAVVSPTDAAAVLVAIRGVHLRHRVAAVLEAESGFNDPLAALLVIGLVEYETHPGYALSDAALLLVQQGAIGAVGGLLVGRAAVALLRRLSLPSAGLAPVLTLSVALAGYVGVSALGGSGLLATYLIGLAIGNARIPNASVVRGFLQGLAWLAQIGLFVMLGLLVTPTRLLSEDLAPLAVAVVLVLIARPLAVTASTMPLGVPRREQAFLAWAGLRGGVPIVFATFPLAAGAPSGRRIFDVVFYVVVVSVALQGFTLRRVAEKLGVTAPARMAQPADFDPGSLHLAGAEMIELDARDLGVLQPTPIRDQRLPGGAVIAAVARGETVIVPRGSTVLEPVDRLYLIMEQSRLHELERHLAAVRGRPGGPARR